MEWKAKLAGALLFLGAAPCLAGGVAVTIRVSGPAPAMQAKAQAEADRAHAAMTKALDGTPDAWVVALLPRQPLDCGLKPVDNSAAWAMALRCKDAHRVSHEMDNAAVPLLAAQVVDAGTIEKMAAATHYSTRQADRMQAYVRAYQHLDGRALVGATAMRTEEAIRAAGALSMLAGDAGLDFSALSQACHKVKIHCRKVGDLLWRSGEIDAMVAGAQLRNLVSEDEEALALSRELAYVTWLHGEMMRMDTVVARGLMANIMDGQRMAEAAEMAIKGARAAPDLLATACLACTSSPNSFVATL